MNKHLLAALAAATLAAPVAAQAQVVPSYGGEASYANSEASYATSEEDVHGRIVGFDGAYTLTVRDERGFIDNVQLHDGTIINPTGLRLEPGMIVNILGYDAGEYLAANEIDTPYTFYEGEPCYEGHVWSYWGPSVGLAFFFGNAGWWHGDYFGGGYAWNGGVRVYNNVTYRTVYRERDGDRDGYRERRPVPIPVDRPPAYHHPIPVDHALSSRPSPVYERPVPLRDNARPSYAGNGSERGWYQRGDTQRSRYQPESNRGSYQPQNNRGGYEPRNNRGTYQPENNRGNYQPENNRGSNGSGRENSAPAHQSRPAEEHERR